MSHLNFWDYAAILAYLVVTAVIGGRAVGRQKTTAEYFVANRRIPAFAVAFTLMATTISSVTFVAIPGSVFARDCWQMLYMYMLLASLFLVVPLVVPFYRRVVRMSAYEYLEQRFGLGARLYGSAGFIVVRLADLGFTLYLTAVAVEVVAGWDLRLVVLLVGVFTLVYTLVGGIEAAIWTSVLQGVLLVGGGLLILVVLLLGTPGGPVANLADAFHGGKLNLGSFDFSFHTLFDPDPTAWILMAAGLLHFSRYYITEQSIVQRYLVAKSDQEAQRGVRMGILATVPTWTLFAVIGACLWSFYRLNALTLPPHIVQQPDSILPYFVATQLPPGVIGLVLAALFSSAMSSVSADLNSIATVATQDYFARARPNAPDPTLLRFGRFAVLGGGLLATATGLALTMTKSTAAYEIVVISVSIVAGGMLGLFALGFLCPRATRTGAYTGILVCLLFVGWATLSGPMKVDLGFNFTMNPILIGVFSHFVLWGAGYLASIAFGGYRPDLSGLTIWGAAPVEEG